jgi:hypothetical protein
MLLLFVLVTFSFHLPEMEAADSCRAPVTQLDDLESCYVWQQVRYQQPRIFERRGVRGLEGQLQSFTAPDTVEALYWVETADSAGNRVRFGSACPPNVVQVAFTTDVPQNPTPAAPAPPRETWYDVAGRKVSSTKLPGVYWSNRGGVRVVLR